MPSFERFGGDVKEPPKFVNVSPSVIAMVEAPQPIAMENVASIGDSKPKKRAPNTLPMVIRGGIIGDAFASRSAPAAPAANVPSAPPQQEVSSAPPPRTKKPQPNAPEMPPSDRLPKSALPPPAPPTGRME